MFFSSSLFFSSGLEMLLTSNKNGCQRPRLDPDSPKQRFRSRAHHPAHMLLFAQRGLDYRVIFVSIHASVFIWIQRKLCLGFAKYSWVFPCFITGIFFFLTQWYTCPLKLDYRSGVVGESEKCCGLSVSRGKDTLTMSLDKLCLWRQEQSSFEETEVKTDFHLMVGTLRFFKKLFTLK